jgi:tetratricopeptide (TPR) repeat protein
MGAKRATDVYAYGEAVRLLEQALKVQQVLDPEEKTKRCDLLLALADALLLAGEYQRIVSTEASQAFSLAEAIGDHKSAGRACLLAMKGLSMYFSVMMASPEAAQWAARADHYAEPETIERAWADAMLGYTKRAGDSTSREGVVLLNQALDLARRIGDPDTYWWIAALWVWSVGAPQHEEEQLRLAEELAEESKAGVNPLTVGLALWAEEHIFLQFGQRRRAEDVMAELRALAERSGQPYLLILSMLNDVIVAAYDGRLEEAIGTRRGVLRRAEELGIPEFGTVWSTWVIPARVFLGDAKRALESVLQGVRSQPQNVAGEMTIIFCLAQLGRYDKVAEILEQMVVARPGIGSAEDETHVWLDVVSLEAAVLAGHRQAAELLLHRLIASQSVTTGIGLHQVISHNLAAAAALLGRPDEARKYYQEAIKVCTEVRFRPRLALSRLQLAELLLEHYPDEKKEALEHLDFAIKEFKDMKMQPSLERALKHKEILGA